MKYYSTKNTDLRVELEEAIFRSLPPDSGLYLPEFLPYLPPSFYKDIQNKTFAEIAYEVARVLIGYDVNNVALQNIVAETVNFPAPIKKIEDRIYVLELFHGPSLAFKDFGARFMSRLMSYFLERNNREIDILVATSGDTGGAVALGFYDVPGVKVTILYPKGKVSPIQEKQLTTLGKNITALEVDGTFDDCQLLVKSAFLDKELNEKMNLSSANSINIARLIPQTFYYFNAYAELKKEYIYDAPVFSVPSGNFGNLTAGLLAEKMGLPVKHFVAATNANDVVPEYLKTGIYKARPSLHTLSNAMDVGNPSNFERMLFLSNRDVENMKAKVSGYTYSDEETLKVIEKVKDETGYILCPHTAVAYLGLKEHLAHLPEGTPGIFLSTAHPCKFPDVYSEEIRKEIHIPEQAASVMDGVKQTVPMTNKFDDFKEWLMNK